MSTPHIHGVGRTFTANRAVEVQNEIVSLIRKEDEATWADIGRVFGKSEDRAAAYGNTASPMDLPTFLAGCKEWKGRFADPLLSLVGGRWADHGSICSTDEAGALTLATLLPAVIQIEADNHTTGDELAPHEQLIRRVNMLTEMWLRMIAEYRASGGDQ